MKISINTIWQRSRDYSYTLGLIKRQINIFWKEVLASWLQIDEKKTPLKKAQLYGITLKLQQITSHSVKSYYSVGFRFVDDIFNLDGTFIRFQALKNIIKDTHFLEYASLRTAIMNRLHKVNIP